MRIAVLGTGMVGRAVSVGLDALGHDVVVGTRDPDATVEREDFARWHGEHPEVSVATYRDAATDADLIMNATNGAGSLAALEAAGEDNLSGRLLIDIANPLQPADGLPNLSVCNTDSLAEQLQRRFPDARVVKTLNTVNASVMIDPGGLAGGDHSIFVSGDDPDAKDEVVTLLRTLGWSDVIDLGDLSTARGPEMYMALWLRVYAVVGHPGFSIKLVR